MKRFGLILLAWMALSLTVLAQQVTLQWNPNTETDLAGYKVYQGMASHTYGAPVILGLVTSYQIDLTGLASGTYIWAVTAFNASGQESGASNEASISIPVGVALVGPPGPPGANGVDGQQGVPGPPGPAGSPGATDTSPFVLIVVPAVNAYSATVAWSTRQECSGTVLWGLAVDKLAGIVIANNLGTIDHLAVIVGLASRVHYFYQVSGMCAGTLIQSDVRSFNSK